MIFLFKLVDISNIKKISFRQDINGLRALAVLAVVFYHAELELFKGGWLGVDIFFVISGYLISNIIISELNEGTFSFKTFYIRRIRRILPALFSTLILTIPFAYFLLTLKAMEEYLDSLIASIFFYSNYHFMNLDFYISESTKVMPLIHTWSLAIEEQYYLIFPLITFIFYKYFKRYFTYLIGFITIGSLYLNSSTQSIDKFYRLEFRIWELLLGVLVMILSNNFKIKHLEKIGLPLMLMPIFYFGDDWINDSEPKLIALIGVSLIIFSNTDYSMLTKVLSFKFISVLGLSSYSIYLLHQPLFAFYRIYSEQITYSYLNLESSNLELEKLLIVNKDKNDNFKFIILFIVLLFGYLSFKYIENNNKIYLLLFTAFFSTLIFTTYLKITNETFNFIPYKKLGLEFSEEAIGDYPCWNKFENFNVKYNNFLECFEFDSSKRNLVILGDSSSVAISKMIIDNSKFENNFNLIQLSTSGDVFLKNILVNQNCNECLYEYLNKHKEKNTIVFSLRYENFLENDESIYFNESNYSVSNFETLQNNLKVIEKLSNNFIYIKPYPQLNLNIKDLLSNKKISNQIQTATISLNFWKRNTQITTEFFKNISEDKIIDYEKLLCTDPMLRCNVYLDNKLYYLDKIHLSTTGAALLKDDLFKVLEKYINN